MEMVVIDELGLADAVKEVLDNIFDPEIPVSIVELGLVYEIHIKKDASVKVIMTLTAPNCPVAGGIISEVQEKVEAIEGVEKSLVELIFDPAWDRSMMSDVARLELGFM